ncbi:MAG: DUF1631 family protein [Burkholderiaceae bacterium]|nr:DUF1631 family protein [Burkholderiaceae bacterium]
MTDPAREVPRVALFEQALSRLSQTLERSLRGAISEVASDLDAAAEFEADPRDRQSLIQSAGLFRMQVPERTTEVVNALADRASRCIEYASRADDEDRALSLLLEDEVEQQMLVNDMARAVRGIVAADYLTFSERVHALWPGLWSNDDLNPLGARTLAASTVQGFAMPGATSLTRLQIRRSLLRRLPAVLALALEDIERWLAGQGVSASGAATRSTAQARTEQEGAGLAASAIERSSAGRASIERGSEQSHPDNAAPDDAAPDDDARDSQAREPGPASAQTEPGQRSIDNTERAADVARILGSSPLARPASAPLPVLPTLQPVVELERDAVAFAHSIGVSPYGREARARFFGNARSRLRDAHVPPAQLAVVDLVAAMFDYVIDDHRLPESVKPMIWRLQQPTLALAILDPAYLGDEPRSLRRLIENLGAIANAFADDMGRGGELHRRLETVVRAVEIVAGALQTRSAVMARQVEHEYTRAARNVTQLIERLVRERSDLESTKAKQNRRDYRRRPSREREEEVTVRLSVMLGERLERHRVPESVREFLLNVWLRQLRTAALRDGEESGEFKVAMQVVDDLLWSLDTQTLRGGRRELAVRIPPLIRLLTQGVREIGVKDDELKPFFDELFLIHLRKMQRSDEDGMGSTARRAQPPTRPVPPMSAPGQGSGNGHDPGTQPPPRAASAQIPSSLRARPPASRRAGDEPTRNRGAGTPDVRDSRAPAAPSPQASRDAARTARSAPESSPAAPPVPPSVLPSVLPPASPASPSPRADASREADLARGAEEEAAAGAPGQRLLEVLSSIDLADLPLHPTIVPMMGADPVARLARGNWIQMFARDGSTSYAKVAWINSRRTVVLLVRHPDRRALSLRAAEVVERFAQGRAFLIE